MPVYPHTAASLEQQRIAFFSHPAAALQPMQPDRQTHKPYPSLFPLLPRPSRPRPARKHRAHLHGVRRRVRPAVSFFRVTAQFEHRAEHREAASFRRHCAYALPAQLRTHPGQCCSSPHNSVAVLSGYHLPQAARSRVWGWPAGDLPGVSPSSRPTAAAASALSTLCAPGILSFAVNLPPAGRDAAGRLLLMISNVPRVVVQACRQGRIRGFPCRR